jgi:hypothetical protein
MPSDAKDKAKIATVVAVVVMLIILIAVLVLRARSEPCTANTVYNYGDRQLTAKEICLETGEIWDDAKGSCSTPFVDINNICPGKDEKISERFCHAVGGKWNSKCKICHNMKLNAAGEPDVNPEQLLGKTMTIMQEECPEAITCTIL